MMMVIVSILALGVLIFVHELGHFLVAKFFGVKVLEFAIGFGPVLCKKQHGETLYAIRVVPLGGFVRMAGDTPHEVEAGEADNVPEEERRRWFLEQKFLPKFLIVFAGPLFNLLFAVLLSTSALYLLGQPYTLETSVIGEVIEGLPADKAGLQAGDNIVAINGEQITLWEEVALKIQASQGAPVELSILRDGGPLTITVVASNASSELDVLAGTEQQPRFKIGIFPSTARKEIGFFKSIELGVKHIVFLTRLTLKGLYEMAFGSISTDNIGGPIFIFEQGAKAAHTGIEDLNNFMIFLSVSLALLNLLPIPVLDGGHLLFFVVEAVKGSPVNLRFQERATQVGMVFLLLLMALALTNDVRRLLE